MDNCMTKGWDMFDTVKATQMPAEMARMDAGEEAAWLMSLALDDALDEAGRARLVELVAADPRLEDVWATWQTLDGDLRAAPQVGPSAQFTAKVGAQVALWERRRRLRTGVVFGVIALALWSGALVGLGIMGAYLWSSQASWVGDGVHELALWWSVISEFGVGLLRAGGSLWMAPEARWAALGYGVVASGILGAWFMFLRRSLRLETVSDLSVATRRR